MYKKNKNAEEKIVGFCRHRMNAHIRMLKYGGGVGHERKLFNYSNFHLTFFVKSASCNVFYEFKKIKKRSFRV